MDDIAHVDHRQQAREILKKFQSFVERQERQFTGQLPSEVDKDDRKLILYHMLPLLESMHRDMEERYVASAKPMPECDGSRRWFPVEWFLLELEVSPSSESTSTRLQKLKLDEWISSVTEIPPSEWKEAWLDIGRLMEEMKLDQDADGI